MGCLLGLAVGDALGGPYEGLTSADIYFQFGTPEFIVTNPSGETLYYTDDTEMMIGVAETLVECGRIEEERLVRAFVENYHPDRGYGQGARKVLGAMARDRDWRTVAATHMPAWQVLRSSHIEAPTQLSSSSSFTKRVWPMT